MKLNDLIYFAEVVEQQSFSKAAETLFVSQPSLTMSVQRLEQQLGTPLLKRRRGEKNMHLTAAGDYVYTHAKKILHELTLIESEMQAQQDTKVDFGLPPIIGEYLFPKLIQFLDSSIIKRLSFVETGSQNMKKLLDDDKLDMALIGTQQPLRDATLESHFIMRDSYTIFLPPAHALARQKALDFEALKNERFVSLGKDYVQYDVLSQLCQSTGQADKISDFLLVNEIETAKRLIANGAGIGFMTSYSLGAAEDLAAVPLNPPIYCYFYLVFKKNHEFTRTERQIKDALIQANLGAGL